MSKYFVFFSVLISNMANTNRFNPHTQKFFEILNDFKEYKGYVNYISIKLEEK